MRSGCGRAQPAESHWCTTDCRDVRAGACGGQTAPGCHYEMPSPGTEPRTGPTGCELGSSPALTGWKRCQTDPSAAQGSPLNPPVNVCHKRTFKLAAMRWLYWTRGNIRADQRWWRPCVCSPRSPIRTSRQRSAAAALPRRTWRSGGASDLGTPRQRSWFSSEWSRASGREHRRNYKDAFR